MMIDLVIAQVVQHEIAAHTRRPSARQIVKSRAFGVQLCPRPPPDVKILPFSASSAWFTRLRRAPCQIRSRRSPSTMNSSGSLRAVFEFTVSQLAGRRSFLVAGFSGAVSFFLNGRRRAFSARCTRKFKDRHRQMLVSAARQLVKVCARRFPP